MDGKHNGSGGEDRENVIRFPSRSGRRKECREPIINLPPATKALALSFLLIHFALQFAPGPLQYWVYEVFGFVPARYTGRAAFGWYAVADPLTYMFLHGGWTHVLLNTFMMAAFGTGAERMMGARRMLVFFTLCSIGGAFAHLAVSPFSTDPVIGASAGISGLFAAVLLMMQKAGMGGTGRYGIWPFVILWVAVSFAFGGMGAPGGGTVAWAAHIGGFLAGFLLLKPVMRYMK